MHLNSCLNTTVGQATDKGPKRQNEDCLGISVPDDPALTMKGVVAVIADGVSSAEAGKEASETCVKNFLSDYYSTPDSWTVKTSAHKILTAINSWLYSKGQQHDESSQGMLTTFSALVLKSTTGHIFHVGDSRVYRLQDKNLECLTTDHRRWVGDKD